MIISYLTEDYFEWSLIFVKTFTGLHPDIKIHLDTRNLKDNQIKEIQKISKNITIKNKKLEIKEISNKYYNISEEQIQKSKDGCMSFKKHNHRLWMNITADGDRILQYKETIKNYPNENLYILTDIDLLFRKPLYELFKKAKKHDVGIKIRAGKKDGILPKKLDLKSYNTRDAKINISTVIINNNNNGIRFLNEWVERNEALPIIDEEKTKRAQYSIAKTYNSLDINYFRIMPNIIDPRLKNDSYVWFFKSKQKDEALKQAKKEMQKNATRYK